MSRWARKSPLLSLSLLPLTYGQGNVGQKNGEKEEKGVIEVMGSRAALTDEGWRKRNVEKCSCCKRQWVLRNKNLFSMSYHFPLFLSGSIIDARKQFFESDAICIYSLRTYLYFPPTPASHTYKGNKMSSDTFFFLSLSHQ